MVTSHMLTDSAGRLNLLAMVALWTSTVVRMVIASIAMSCLLAPDAGAQTGDVTHGKSLWTVSVNFLPATGFKAGGYPNAAITASGDPHW